MDLNEAVALSPGIYWVGAAENQNNLHCNSYLITHNRRGLLIDPGPVGEFEAVARKVRSILPIEALDYIVLLHQDPDVAGSTPLFEGAGFRGEIATHWRTSMIAAYYGISSDYYLVNEQNFKLTLGDDRLISFIPAPYLHFPGAVMALDTHSRTLFSGDLFGAISSTWSLFAEADYREKMIPFHEHYVPSNEVIRPVMDSLLNREINMICPQHGSIIKEEITAHITTLRDLECGLFLHPVRTELQSQGGVQRLAEQVLSRLIAFSGAEAVSEWFKDSKFTLDPQRGVITDYQGNIEDMWNDLFDMVFHADGSRLISLLEPMVEKFQREYGIAKPRVYQSALLQEQQVTAQLRKEKEALEAVNASLQKNLDLTREEMTKDQVTGLYNEDFFVRYLLNIFNEEHWNEFHTIFIQIDNMREINDSHGDYEGDEIIQQVGSILFYEKQKLDYLFRIDGPVFVLVSSRKTREAVIEQAEELRSRIEDDRRFFKQITVSLGIVSANHDLIGALSATEAMEYVFTIGRQILRKAQRSGGNRVVEDIYASEREGTEGRVVIIEYDHFHAQLIQEALESLSIRTKICMNGPEAIETIKDFHPDVIISELFLLETDAFSVREELLEYSRTKDIPFMIISHQKNEAAVVRAIHMGIVHYLKKPYMLPELLGIVDAYVTKAMQHGS
ncbi:MAG: diguanylate cyclase [Spirochaetia bacterium]